MPLHLFAGRMTSATPRRGSHRRRTSPGISEKSRYPSTGCQTGPSVNLNPVAICVTCASRSTRRSNAPLSATWFMAGASPIGRSFCALAQLFDARWPQVPVARRDLLEDDPDVALGQAGGLADGARDFFRNRRLLAL